MAINPQLTAVLTTATILLMVADNAAAARRAALSGDLCSRTDYPAICKTMVKGQMKPNAATEMAIKALMSTTKVWISGREPLDFRENLVQSAQQWVKTAAAKGKRGNGAISTCYSNLDSALDNLEKALGNIKENDGFSLNSNLSAALSDYVTCKDAVAGAVKGNLVAKSAGVLQQMADNCLALSTFVKQ